MPYLHCPACRLTIFKPRQLVRSPERCPRCNARLGHAPARLFETMGGAPGASEAGGRAPETTRGAL